MADGKLIIKSDEAGIELECQFNPNQLSLKKGVCYKKDPNSKQDEPNKSLIGGDTLSLSLKELTFDTSQTGDNVHKKYIADLLTCVQINKYKGQDRTPYCSIHWGSFVVTPFNLKHGVIKSADVTYTMFLSDGTPIRAKADVTFEVVNEDQLGTNPTSRTKPKKTWLVQEGQTLDWIAYQEYGNPGHWRHIALTNDLLNPKQIFPGQLLKLVPLS